MFEFISKTKGIKMTVLKNHEQKLNYVLESLTALQKRMEQNALSGNQRQENMLDVEIELNVTR